MIPTLLEVKSSNILGISYDEEAKELFVLFKQKKIYKYTNVLPQDFLSFLNASSKGSHFHRNIRNTFRTEFIKEVKETQPVVILVKGIKHRLILTDIDKERGYILHEGKRIPQKNNGSESVKSPKEAIK